jgi:hypothetical protein
MEVKTKRKQGSVAEVVNALIDLGFTKSGYYTPKGINQVVVKYAKKCGVYLSTSWFMTARNACISKGHIRYGRFFNTTGDTYIKWLTNCITILASKGIPA